MRKAIPFILTLIFVLAAVIPISAVGTDPVFTGDPSLDLLDQPVRSSSQLAYPYLTTATVNNPFRPTIDNAYEISLANNAPFFVTTNATSNSSNYAFVISSYPEYLSSVSDVFVSGSNVTLSSVSSFTSDGVTLNYVYFWYPYESHSCMPSIPYFSSINQALTSCVNTLISQRDYTNFVLRVPKVQPLTVDTLSSEGASLRSSSPYFYYGASNNNFYRACYHTIQNSSIGGNAGVDFYHTYFYTSSDMSISYSLPVLAYTNLQGDLVQLYNSDFAFDETLGLYYAHISTGNSATSSSLDTYVYSDPYSLKKGVADFFGTVFNTSSSYSLPAGNVLYIDLGGSNVAYNLDLSVTMPSRSHLIGDPFNPSQYFFFDSALPLLDQEVSGQLSNSTTIRWSKDPSGGSAFYQLTNKAVYNLAGSSSSRYLAIVNPLYYSFGGVTDSLLNGSVIISGIPPTARVYSYPITSSFNGSYYVETIGGKGGTGIAAPDGGPIQLVNSDNPEIDYVAPLGGTNDLSESESIQGTVSGLKSTLSTFFSNILELLGKPVAYVQNLISAGAAFIQQISGLWTWLPSEVASLVTSALVVIICVGVFKVFL